MAELVGGALLGLAFTKLWDAVEEAKDRIEDFKPQLAELEGALKRLKPIMQKMERINTRLKNESDQRQIESLASIMKKGKKLVSKCRRPQNFLKKALYGRQLDKLNNRLQRFYVSYMLDDTFQEVKKGFERISDEIGSLGSSTSSAAGATTNFSTSITTSAAGNRAPTIGTVGLICLIILPNVDVMVKITALVVLICLAMTAIMSMLERSESGIWMVIKDVGMLKITIQQLEATMKSLAPVLEEIESNGQRDRSEDAKRLRSLLEEGGKLVFESSNIGWWNFVKKWQYQKKMVELDNKLLKFHSLFLQARLSKNNDKTDDDSDMKDDDELSVPAHYDQDRPEMEGRHMDTREHESYSMLNNNPHQYLRYKNPPISSSIGAGSQQYALGR